MENVLTRYKRPIESVAEPTVAVEYWDTALDAFDEKTLKNQ